MSALKQRFICQQTHLDKLGHMIRDLDKELNENTESILKSYISGEKTDLSCVVKQISQAVFFTVKLVSDYYEDIKTGINNLMEDKSNLQVVNKKLLERIQEQKRHPMQPTVSASTQTDEAFEILNNSTVTIDTDPVNTIENNSFNCSNSAHNFTPKLNNNNSSKSTDSKLSKVIIYNISEDADTADILTAISDKIGGEIPSIHFVKKSQRKSSNKFNYIIEVPQEVTTLLTYGKTIQILDSMCHVKRFVTLKRCYVCQEYGHIARSCNKEKICGWCGESHDDVKKCVKPPKCINCDHNNRKYNHNFKVDHPAFSQSCSSFKFNILNARLKSMYKSYNSSFTFNESEISSIVNSSLLSSTVNQHI